MKRVPVIVVGLIASFALITFVWIRWQNSPLGKYRTFLRQDKPYYTQIATACDAMIAQLAAGQSVVPFIPGDAKSVPEVLRSLKADSFYVATDRVSVRFGVGRISSTIVWEASSDPTQWKLIAVAGESDITRIVFEKKR